MKLKQCLSQLFKQVVSNIRFQQVKFSRSKDLSSQVGKTVEFKNVLFLNDDKNTEIGNPVIKGAKVEATILKNTKNRTVLVFKKRRRKNSRKKYGHRQPITLIKITKIFSKEGKIIAQVDIPKKSEYKFSKKICIPENKVEKAKADLDFLKKT